MCVYICVIMRPITVKGHLFSLYLRMQSLGMNHRMGVHTIVYARVVLEELRSGYCLVVSCAARCFPASVLRGGHPAGVRVVRPQAATTQSLQQLITP